MQKILITGANRGIGLELCRQYKNEGHELWALCRQSSADLKSLGVHKIIEDFDLGTPDAIESLINKLPEKYFDLHIHNAGVFYKENNIESYVKSFSINAAATLYAAETLIPTLTVGAKIAFVSSRMGSIADNSSGGYYAYRMSKAALNAGAHSFSIDLRAKGHPVIILHPGFVRTRMTSNNGDIDTAESATGLRARIAELSLDKTGSFYHQNGEELPW